MKKLFKIVITIIFICLINSCAVKFKGEDIVSEKISVSNIPRLSNIEYQIDHKSVIFKWESIASLGLTGVAIYKRNGAINTINQSYRFTNIATINNPLTNYYLDQNLKENSTYTYIFKTLKNNYESYSSKPIVIKTLGFLKEVTNFRGIQKYSDTIYLTWNLHSDNRIAYYQIQRSINESNWEVIIKINHRLITEYIDTSILKNNNYYYKITAFTFDGTSTKDSKVIKIYSRETSSI